MKKDTITPQDLREHPVAILITITDNDDRYEAGNDFTTFVTEAVDEQIEAIISAFVRSREQLQERLGYTVKEQYWYLDDSKVGV